MKSSRISIGRVSIRGVDPATARELGPAIERALGRGIDPGRAEQQARNLSLALPSGAGSSDIAGAIARALGKPSR